MMIKIIYKSTVIYKLLSSEFQYSNHLEYKPITPAGYKPLY